MATTTHGSFSPDFNASDTHHEIVNKTKEMLRRKRIKSPDIKKMFCVEFPDMPRTKKYTTSKKRYKELLKMRDEMEQNK